MQVRRTEQSPAVAKHCPSGKRASPQTLQVHSAKLPLDCRHRGRKHGEMGGTTQQGSRKSLRRSRGVLALIGFSKKKGNSFVKLFKKDPQVCPLGGKRLNATLSLWNIAKWREMTAKLILPIQPISGHYINLFL